MEKILVAAKDVMLGLIKEEKGFVVQYCNPELINDESHIKELLMAYPSPNILVVTNNLISADTIRDWSYRNRGKRLLIVRRGTSTDTIKITEAKSKYGVQNVDVLNIDGFQQGGVNSPYVADYLYRQIEERNTPERKDEYITILGVGNIGGILAHKLLAEGYKLRLHSKSLKPSNPRSIFRMRQLGLDVSDSRIECVETVNDAMKDASCVAIALPLVNGQAHDEIATKGLIKAEDIDAMAVGGHIISVSKPQIFYDPADCTDKSGQSAFSAIAERASKDELKYTQDYGGPAKVYVKSKFKADQKNVWFTSDAMGNPKCQEKMDQALYQTIKFWVEHNQQMLFLEEALKVLPREMEQHPYNEKVLVLGGGIVGLTTACFLKQVGYDVEVIAAESDPDGPRQEGMGFESTTSVEDARHFSITESTIFPTTNRLHSLDSYASDGGLKIVNPSSENERDWKYDFDRLAEINIVQECIDQKITRINANGIKMWQRLRAERPDLFESIQYAPVMRVFLDEDSFHKEKKKQFCSHKGAELDASGLSKEQLMQKIPALEKSISSGRIVGGIEVAGFGINVNEFMRRLRKDLESKGVSFTWRHKVEGLDYHYQVQPSTMKACINGVAGVKVRNLVNEEVSTRVANHYVLATGVDNYDQYYDQVAGPAPNVQGVAGVWITLVNEEKINCPLKIHAADPLGVVNITPGQGGKLHIGGGFGFVGQAKPDISHPEMQSMLHQLMALMKEVLPLSYKKTEEREEGFNPKVCIRPMTPSGMGDFEMLRTKGNGCFITNIGHGASGATQAWALAHQVAKEISGHGQYINTIITKRYFEDRLINFDDIPKGASCSLAAKL